MLTNAKPTTAVQVAMKLALINEDAELMTALSMRGVHPQALTGLFHEKFDAPIHFPTAENPLTTDFAHMDDERLAFRVAFLLSEVFELIEDGLGLFVKFGVSDDGFFEDMVEGSNNGKLASLVLKALQTGGKRDLVSVVDALGDINVVNNGFAIELGVNMEMVDREIFASNMTKLGEDGKPIVADGSDPNYPAGKILKGPNFMQPQLAELLGL